MMAKSRVVVLVLMAGLQACAPVEAPAPGHDAAISSEVLDTITMRDDRNIVVRYTRSKTMPDLPDIEISPDKDAYQPYIDMVGDLKPGETRSFKSYIGVAHMRDDGSIDARWLGSGYGALIAEPYMENIKPDDPRHTALLKRVGGLAVGQSKTIPKE